MLHRYEIAATTLASFVYERDYAGHDLPAPIEPETTAEAVAIAEDMPDGNEPAEGVGAAFADFVENLLRAIPTDRALDTSYLLPDGHIKSWRSRLAHDILQAMTWQVGHADEAETFAADELIAAYRACDETEIALARIDTAETRVRQAEQRCVWWREARAAVVARLQATGYPIVGPSSTEGVELAIGDAVRAFQNELGSPTRAFLAHRMLWGIVRIADRGLASVQKRWAKAQTNRAASRDCEVQHRAYSLIRDILNAAYDAATGTSIGQIGAKGETSPTASRAETAAWIEADRRTRARAFAA